MELTRPGLASRWLSPLDPRATIFRRSLLQVAFVALPLLLLGAWVIEANYEAVRASVEGRLLDAARTLAEEVDREFERGEAALLALSASSALRSGDLDAFEGEMRAVARGMGAKIGLATADGFQALNTIWGPGERRRGVPAPAPALEALATSRARVSDLFDGPSDGRPVVALSVPVVAPDAADEGRPASHVLGFVVPPERFAAMIVKATGHDPGAAFGGAIFDRTGRFVARHRNNEAWVGRHAQPDMLALLARHEEGIARDRRDREGNAVVSAFAHAPRTRFAVAFGAPKEALYAPLRRTARRSAATASAVLFCCLGLALFCSRRLAATFRRIPQEVLGRGPSDPARAPCGLREADDLAAALALAVAERDRAHAEVKALFDTSPVGMVRVRLDGTVLDANDAYLRMRETTRARVLAGRVNCGQDISEDGLARQMAAVAEVLRDGACAPFEKEFVFPDGRRRPVLVVFALLNRDRDEGAAFVVDLTEQKNAQAALAQSEARLTRALSSARMATWEWDCASDALLGSKGVEALYGRAPGELATGAAELATVHPDDLAKRMEAHRLRGRGEDAFDEQYRVVRPDGAVRWLHAMGSVTARDAAGEPRLATGVVMDVTPLKEEQARRELLTREVDHRAKNVLAVVQAVLKLTVAEDPKEFTKVVEGRIAALAHAHTLLARDKWAGADVRALLDEELAPFLAGRADGRGGRVVLDGPEAALSPWAVQPFAMALHELATNAAKYGALSKGGGDLAVAWRVDGPAGLELRWEEKAARKLAGRPTRRGFGTRVIDSTVRDQLRGSIQREWTEDGLLCTIRVPAAQLAGARNGAEVRLRAPQPLVRRPPPAAPGEALDLAGRRVLVVEDEAVLAQALIASLSALGVDVVGPAASLEDGLRLAATAPDLDAAVLDVNLAGRFSYPVADVLAGRGVPTVFATGYGSLPAEGIVARHDAVPLLRKPLAHADLMEALREATAARAAEGRVPVG